MSRDEDYFDKYTDLEDVLFPPEKSGGGGGKKKSQQHPGPKTSKAKKQEVVEASQEKRREEAGVALRKVFDGFSKQDESFLEMYVAWVNLSLVGGTPIVEEADLEEKFVRSGGAGGQNVNKVSTAVQLRHVPTNIMVRNEETRSQETNREKAREVLSASLKDHLESFQEYFGSQAIDKETLISSSIF